MNNNSANFVERILLQCQQQADKVALYLPEYDQDSGETHYDELRYSEIKQAIADYQAGFAAEGFVAGDRIIVLFKPGRELYCLLLAMLASGLVPVFIDRGMSVGKILQALKDAKAKAFISIKALLRWRWLLPVLWRCRCYAVDGDGLGIKSLARLRRSSDVEPVLYHCDDDTHGLITFTSGSTGRPKGTDRTHASLRQQHIALDALWPLTPEDIALTALPVTTLHGLSCGVTGLLADCDLAQPGAVNPERVVKQLQDFKVRHLMGAPAFIVRIADYLQKNQIVLPHLQKVYVGGAPSSPAMCRRYRQGFTDTEIVIIYGSTEAEPISTVTVEEILSASGDGVLVGQPVAIASVKLVRLPDDKHISESELEQYIVKHGDIGEVVVKGPHVLRAYIDNLQATRENKISCSDGEVWHRTGDTAYFDLQQHLWLTGRLKDVVSHQGKTIQPFPVEIAIDEIGGIRRSAVINAIEDERALLVIEADSGTDQVTLKKAVNDILAQQQLDDVEVNFIDKIPMDGRHNSKIDRPTLRQRFSEKAITPDSDSRWIIRLNWVDVFSLCGVIPAFLAVGLILAGQFAFALAALFAAMLFDALDGMLARRFNTTREFGRYLDGFIDVLDYLIVPSLFLYQWGFQHPLYWMVLMLMFSSGIIRLSVFNQTGNLSNESSGLGYWGMPVFWSAFIVAAAYLLSVVISKTLLFPILALVLIIYSLAMLYNGFFFKFKKLSHILGLTLGGVTLFLVIGIYQQMAPTIQQQSYLITALILMLPAVVGGMLHMLVVSKNWLSQLAIPIQKTWFGENKTWRGVLTMPLLSILGAWPVTWLAGVYPISINIQNTLMDTVLLGLLMGLAYILFELPNSFLKRRLGIPPGQSANRYRGLFITLDQFDSGIGLAVVAALFYQAPWPVALLMLLLFPLVALICKRILFMLKLKKNYV